MVAAMKKNVIAGVITAIAISIIAIHALAGQLVEERSVLSGYVAKEGLAFVGQVVHEGDVLVNVKTMMGLTPAVRATVDGKVKEVRVQPGAPINSGDVAVCLETIGK